MSTEACINPHGSVEERELDVFQVEELDVGRAPETPKGPNVLSLAHDRCLWQTPTERGDLLEVRSRSGEIELSIEFSSTGAKLRFTGAEISLSATKRMTLESEELSIRAASMDLDVKGAMRAKAASRHTTIGGADLLEADTLETQANEGSVIVRARDDIRLDGEHIGLNDEALPAPLPWTTAARGSER